MHWQHSSDYVRLMIEEGGDFTIGEDGDVPLITEVFSSMLISYIDLQSYSLILLCS